MAGVRVLMVLAMASSGFAGVLLVGAVALLAVLPAAVAEGRGERRLF